MIHSRRNPITQSRYVIVGWPRCCAFSWHTPRHHGGLRNSSLIIGLHLGRWHWTADITRRP